METRGGVRPNSGRKTAKEENGRLEILDKAWWIVKEWMNDEEVPIKERRTVALELVKKSVPQNLDVTSKGKQLQPVLVKFLDENNRDSNRIPETV